MRHTLMIALLLGPVMGSCKQERKVEERPTATGMNQPAPPAPTARPTPTTPITPTTPPTREPAAARTTTTPQRSTGAENRPEVAVTQQLVHMKDVKWMDGPPALPKGAKFAVLEGEPPFDTAKTFTIVAKLPKNYTIMPHTHLVTERVTVLSGELSFGHGDKLDRKTATKVKAGGLVLIPADHVHYAFTTGKETMLALTGVGPWDVIYVDPKDDPRPTPARKPDNFVKSAWDAPVDAKIIQPNEVRFENPPAGMLPEGAKMAVLEGDPNEAKTYTIRLQMPKGFKLPVHTHSYSERFMVVGGTAKFAFGDTWDAKGMEKMETSSVGIVPANDKHYAYAEAGPFTVQINGVGPLDIKWANPADMPAKR